MAARANEGERRDAPAHETQTATTFAVAVFAKPLMGKGACLVAKGGIEPPTRGFSIHACVTDRAETTRTSVTNQVLRAHSSAAERSHSHLFPMRVSETASDASHADSM